MKSPFRISYRYRKETFIMAKKSSKKDGGQRYDWDKVKIYYVTTPGSSLKKTAEKFGIRFRTVADKSSADNWFATKKEYHRELTNNVTKKVRTIQEDKLAKEVIAADAIADVITKMLEDPQQFYRHLVTSTQGAEITTTEEVFNKVDVRAVRDAVAVLKAVEEMKRSIIGIQKIEPLQKHQLDVERLQLEREKFEFEKQKAEMLKPDSSNVIRIEGLEEGWSE